MNFEKVSTFSEAEKVAKMYKKIRLLFIDKEKIRLTDWKWEKSINCSEFLKNNICELIFIKKLWVAQLLVPPPIKCNISLFWVSLYHLVTWQSMSFTLSCQSLNWRKTHIYLVIYVVRRMVKVKEGGKAFPNLTVKKAAIKSDNVGSPSNHNNH